jgi:DNA-binding transcriptional ArsR family regulator
MFPSLQRRQLVRKLLISDFPACNSIKTARKADAIHPKSAIGHAECGWYIQTMETVLRALADKSRRAMLETLSGGPATGGELVSLLPTARPGVSRHQRVLREAGLVQVRQQAQRRVYRLRLGPLAEVDAWLSRWRALWEQRLDALHTEVARGKRERGSTR